PPRRINEIVHGKRGSTADTALRLARFFGTTERFWLNLQARFDLETEKDRLGDRLETEVEIFRRPDRDRSSQSQPVGGLPARPNRPSSSRAARVGETRPSMTARSRSGNRSDTCGDRRKVSISSSSIRDQNQCRF